MTAPLAVRVDGGAPAAGWPLDRGLHYGDGLFETLLVRDGQLRFEALHRARLAEGCRRLAIAADEQALWSQAREMAATHPACTLKVIVTRGDALARGYTPAGNEKPRVLLLAYPPPAPDELPAVVRAATLRSILGENPQLAGLKHCSRLEQVLGRQELRGRKAFEGLMASSSGHLVSGTMSNAFLELDGAYVTPSLEHCGVAGVMRAVALREAEHCGLSIRVADVPFESLRECTALFLSNARMGIVEVAELDGRRLQSRPAVRQLIERTRFLAA